MNVLYVSIPISLLLLAIAVWAFFWAVRSGQYDDLESPAYSIFLDDKTAKNKKTANNETAVKDKQ